MTDSRLQQIGPRLRAARKASGMTLEQLARRAGMSTSTLSRLESGKRQANLELLMPLTRELRIGLDDLIGKEVPDPRVNEQPFRADGATIKPLVPQNSPLRVFRISYPPRRRRPTRKTHDGYDWIYVLSGRLRLLLGDHDLVLEPGESAEFDTRVPHAMAAVGDQPAEVISIFNASGEKIHTRARTR